MKPCKTCGSHAINPGQNGRDIGVNDDLCDVCYWRDKADDSYREGYNYGYSDGLNLAKALELNAMQVEKLTKGKK